MYTGQIEHRGKFRLIIFLNTQRRWCARILRHDVSTESPVATWRCYFQHLHPLRAAWIGMVLVKLYSQR